MRKAYQLLSAALASAVDSGLIPLTPCRNVKLPSLDSSEMRFLDPEGVRLLADTIDHQYRALVLTAAYTGVRLGELAALRRDRLDALRRTVRVEESLAECEASSSSKARSQERHGGPSRFPDSS